MTETQRKYLQFILDYSREHKKYPTRTVIAEAFGVHQNNVKIMITRLIVNGYIIHAPRKWHIGKLTKKALQELDRSVS